MKTIEQQDIQSLHRIRERLIKSRTALGNEMRGLLAEYGIIIPQGLKRLRQALLALPQKGETISANRPDTCTHLNPPCFDPLFSLAFPGGSIHVPEFQKFSRGLRMYLCHAYDVLSGVIKDLRFAPWNDEISHAKNMVKNFGRNSLTLHDRLYISGKMILAHH